MVENGQVIDASLHRGRERVISGKGVRELSGAAPARTFDGVDDGGAVRWIAIRDVGMPERGPFVDTDRLSVLEDVRKHQDRRMAPHPQVVEKVGILTAEALREGIELRELEGLIPDHDELMGMERIEELSFRLIVQRLGEIDAGDLDAEDSGQALDGEAHPGSLMKSRIFLPEAAAQLRLP
jgi:hypothetical protein